MQSAKCLRHRALSPPECVVKPALVMGSFSAACTARRKRAKSSMKSHDALGHHATAGCAAPLCGRTGRANARNWVPLRLRLVGVTAVAGSRTSLCEWSVQPALGTSSCFSLCLLASAFSLPAPATPNRRLHPDSGVTTPTPRECRRRRRCPRRGVRKVGGRVVGLSRSAALPCSDAFAPPGSFRRRSEPH